MKKLFYLIIVMLVLGLLLPAAAVADETQSPSASSSEGMMFAATVMPLDGSWIILDEIMTAPAFFLIGSPWAWDSVFAVKFTITDLYVVTDWFKVYDWGSFVVETPNLPDWDTYVGGPMVSPPYTTDPDTALTDGRFDSAVIYFASGSHSITIEDIHIPPTGMNGAFIDGTVAFKAELYSLEVDIDIKPGSFPNSINLKSKGVIPVAFLGSAIFDVTDVDVETLEFGPAGATPAHDLTDADVYADHLQDVDLDGFMDLVCHFKTQEVGLVAGSSDATLTGETTDGVIVYGTDSVNIVGK